MDARAAARIRSLTTVPSGSALGAATASLSVHEHERDIPGVAIPGSQAHLVVRFGPSTNDGIDVHALGGRQRVHRKLLRRGQRIVMARLHLGATEAVLGVPAAAIAGSRSGGHVRENAEAASIDLTDSLEGLEQLIPLGPSFATAG